MPTQLTKVNTLDFSSETLKDRKGSEWQFQITKASKCQPALLNPEELAFKNWWRNKDILRQSQTTALWLSSQHWWQELQEYYAQRKESLSHDSTGKIILETMRWLSGKRHLLPSLRTWVNILWDYAIYKLKSKWWQRIHICEGLK